MSYRVGPITLPLSSVQLLDPVDGFGAGAKLYLYSSTSKDGDYLLIGSETIVAGTEVIYIVDPAGTSATWYKARWGNSGATDFGEYSEGFRAGSDDAYASLAAFKATVKTVSDTNDAALVGYLVSASAWLDAKCGRQFYRAPQVSGTETRTFRIRHSSGSLVSAIGHGVDIVSITSIEIAQYTGGTYTTLDATDWILSDPAYPGFPSQDVLLSDVGSYRTWPRGYATVRITGVFGFAAIPDMIARACIEVAREMHRQGPGGATAGQAGVNEYGTPIFMTGYPPSVRDVVSVTSPYRMQSFAWV